MGRSKSDQSTATCADESRRRRTDEEAVMVCMFIIYDLFPSSILDMEFLGLEAEDVEVLG